MQDGQDRGRSCPPPCFRRRQLTAHMRCPVVVHLHLLQLIQKPTCCGVSIWLAGCANKWLCMPPQLLVVALHGLLQALCLCRLQLVNLCLLLLLPLCRGGKEGEVEAPGRQRHGGSTGSAEACLE